MKQSPDVYVLLGSNIDPYENMKRALAYLRAHCEVLAVSSVYRTPPQEFLDQDDFLNMAVKLHTQLDAMSFKTKIGGGLEKALNRVRDPNNRAGPRTIDLDISLWGDAVFEYGHKPWRVPDKDILRFAYVAIPLAELAPDFIHPETGQTLSQIAASLDASGIEKLALDLNDM
ncbi:MAG: 2-amino-4-hydroxy-6-hydroxymethyldihydropteridine diphosphokinase [Phototrophicales bacterium]|nr:MAG: 2-amino-4-hydroxy-6-hydroxymethyldihydropteridine diphosphokinase [Phototrophicales bacterium]